MFSVEAAAAESIRNAYIDGGQVAAMIELRRHFPGIEDEEDARNCAITIARWAPYQAGRQARQCRIVLARNSRTGLPQSGYSTNR
jgi:hypothetical protein